MAIDTDQWQDVDQPQGSDDEPAYTGSVSNEQEPQEDEWQDVAPEGGQQSPSLSASEAPSGGQAGGDEWTDAEPAVGSGGVGSFLREGARAVPAGVVGGAVGLAAAESGAAASLPFAPLAGPLAPAVPLVAGGLAGLIAGGGASWLASLGEDKIIALMGLNKGSGMLSDAQHEADLSTTAGKAGNILGSVVPGFGVGKGAMLGARAIGGALQAGVNAGQQYATTGEIDPTEVGIAGAAGAAFPQPRAWMSKVIPTPNYRGGNKNPDLKEIPAETPAQEAAAPAPQEDEITVNNDVTMTAPGVAQENAPVPETPGAGNPEGAPMQAREAARPSEPERNYAKGQPQTQPETTESKVIDTEPMKSDIKAALEADQQTAGEGEQVPPPAAGTDVLPATQEAVPTNPERTSNTAIEINGERQPAMEQAIDQNVQHAQQEPQPLTPEEQKSLAEDRKILAKAGWDRALAALDSVSPRQQLEAVRMGANEIRKSQAAEAGVKPSEGEVRRPTGELRKESRAKLDTGSLAPSKKEAARRQGAIDAYNNIYNEFGPSSEKGKAIDPLNADKVKDTRAYTKQVWEEAKKRLGGDPFARGSGIYVPFKRTEGVNNAVQWLKAVKASANGQNHKSFATLHTNEGMGALDRETGNVEGDIGHRVQLPDVAVQNETAGDLGTARTTFEHMEPDPRPNADNSYVEDHNKLADWLNERSPNEYSKLAEHYDLNAEMDEPADPAELMRDMKQVLADTGRRPKGEITSEVDLPPRKEAIPTLPQKPQEAAAPGRTLDKNSDEFKRLAAMYEANAPKGPAKSKEAQLSDLADKEASMKEADRTTAKLEAERAPLDVEEAVKGGWGDLADKVKKFAGNEEGGAKIPAWVMNRFNPNNPAAPNAHAAVREYAESISNEFKRGIGREKNMLMETNARLAAAPALDNTRWSKIGEAVQDRTTAALPADLKQVYDDHVAPLRDRADKLYREVYKFNDDHHMGLDLPDPDIQGPAKDYMPRRLKGKQVYDKAEMEKFDPLSGRTLSVFSPSLMDREWMALHNQKTGDRLVIQKGEDTDGNAKWTVWRNGSPQVLKNVQKALTGNVGDVMNLTVKGQKNDWTFDHATTGEIKKATGGRVEYHDNPMMMLSQQVDDLGKNLNNMKMIHDLTSDPRWLEHTTTNKKVAQERGYDLNPVDLEALGRRNGRQVYMPANLRWALNDFFKKGFGGTELDPYRRAAANVFKSFFALSPIVHPLNELDLAIVSRGSKWLPGTGGYRSLFENLPRAIKSVNEQDYHQKNIAAFGGNPMLASVKVREMYPDAARKFGMDIANHPSKWDPIAKMWGVSTADLAKTVYNASSDVTWRLSDYLLTLRYLENLNEGHSIESAVKDAHKFVSDYHMPTTVIGKGKVGRAISSTLSDPFAVAFGRYKYGVFKSIANMTKDIAKGTPAERNKALGQLGAAIAMAWIVYPALDKGLQAISGNDKAEMSRRGLSAIPRAISDSMRKGTINPILTHAVTPSPVLSMGMEGIRNQDWNGKPIIPEGVWPNPVRAGAYAADWAARNIVPPYNAISQGLVKQGGGVLPTAGHFIGEQVGAKFPTERAGKFENQQARRVNQQERQRLRHGEPGILPDLYDRFTGRK